MQSGHLNTAARWETSSFEPKPQSKRCEHAAGREHADGRECDGGADDALVHGQPYAGALRVSPICPRHTQCTGAGTHTSLPSRHGTPSARASAPPLQACCATVHVPRPRSAVTTATHDHCTCTAAALRSHDRHSRPLYMYRGPYQMLRTKICIARSMILVLTMIYSDAFHEVRAHAFSVVHTVPVLYALTTTLTTTVLSTIIVLVPYSRPQY
eukprot:COSAG02_NODE_341_length_24173_cov_28.504777_14_plen_212_part_00